MSPKLEIAQSGIFSPMQLNLHQSPNCPTHQVQRVLFGGPAGLISRPRLHLRFQREARSLPSALTRVPVVQTRTMALLPIRAPKRVRLCLRVLDGRQRASSGRLGRSVTRLRDGEKALQRVTMRDPRPLQFRHRRLQTERIQSRGAGRARGHAKGFRKPP